MTCDAFPSAVLSKVADKVRAEADRTLTEEGKREAAGLEWR